MDSSNSGPRPGFFWQGLMIILPVLVLAVVGLVSLREDAQAAEQAARKRAAESADSLARAMGNMADEELQKFAALQTAWLGTWFVATQDRKPWSADQPDEKLQAAIAQWERPYPGLRLTALALPDCYILADGRQITPPDNPAAPVPPKWFCELSAKQKELWEALRQGRGAAQDFLDTNPSEDARQAALTIDRTPEQILSGPPLPPAESGITFQDVACYQLLEAGAPLTGQLLDAVWQRLFDKPSLVAPALLKLVEGQTNRADSFTQERVRRMRQFWERQCAARQFLEPLVKLPEFRAWSTNSFWTAWSQTSLDRALGIATPALVNTNGDATGRRLIGAGWIISFVPEQVLEAIFNRALAENRFLVPDCAGAAISIENEPLSMPDDKFRPADESRLAAATRKFGGAPYRSDAATLSIVFYLTSREKMLAAEQRRARLFGALIGAAVLAALGGLLTARRAFFQQHRLSEMKTNFVSSVSHELRAPIASMRLLAEGLERGKISDAGKKQEYYRFLVQESRRLTSLIENVLDFSRIEQGRKAYQREPSDLDAIVDQTVKLMLPGAFEKQVELVRQPGPGPGPLLSCDGLAIQQALINLIDNAIKHSPAGARITVGLEGATGNVVHLWVEDQGSGIPPEEHEKIFERFYRRGSELRRETQGIGIGLTIVKHIAQAHGGRVLVRSAAGQGSRFTIELPATSE